jgi:predicted ATPase
LSVAAFVEGFRSLSSSSEIRIGEGINIIVGPNNSGKSNLLRAVALILSPKGYRSDVLDRLDYRDPSAPTARVILRIHDPGILAKRHHGKPYAGEVESFLSHLFKSQNSIEVAYSVSSTGKELEFITEPLKDHVAAAFRNNQPLMQRVWAHLNDRSGGGYDQHWVPESIRPLFDILPDIQRPTVYLNSTRYITDGAEIKHASHAPIMSKPLEPNTIVELLFKLQNPRPGEERDRIKFRAIRDFLRDVTSNQTLELDVSHDKSTINIEMDQRRLPLSNLGSGIEQLLIIATFAVSFQNETILIDEPELHIHPILQRKLMMFLNKTGNRFFITTHSPSIIDAVPATVHKVQLLNGETVVSAVNIPSERYAAVSELGYRPSDLVQTNFIIWVEGPFDKIYIKSWLRQLDPTLLEGIDYSVVFYGGKVLSHFAIGNETEREFVDVLTINRRCAIMIDSDRSAEDKPINATKTRVIGEAERAGAVAIITEGREIENYVSPEIYKRIMTEFGIERPKYGMFADLMTVGTGESKKKIDKIKFAHRAVELEPLPASEALRKKLKEIVDHIRHASLRAL